jgi:hypothetical protein
MTRTLRSFGLACTACALALVALSLLHPWGELRRPGGATAELLQGSTVPPEIRAALDRKCGDCHSGHTRWPLYSRVAPVAWLVEHDVHEGREHLDLSRWQRYSSDEQMDLLARIATQLRHGKMPPRAYQWMHRDARLGAEEQEQIRAWARSERSRLKLLAAR